MNTLWTTNFAWDDIYDERRTKAGRAAGSKRTEGIVPPVTICRITTTLRRELEKAGVDKRQAFIITQAIYDEHQGRERLAALASNLADQMIRVAASARTGGARCVDSDGELFGAALNALCGAVSARHETAMQMIALLPKHLRAAAADVLNAEVGQ